MDPMMEVDEDDNEAVEDVAVTPPERPQRPALSPARLKLASSLKKLKLGLVKAMGPEPTPSEFKPLRYRIFMPLAKLAAKAEKLAKTPSRPPHLNGNQAPSSNPLVRLFPRLAAIDFKSKAGQLRAAGNALVVKQGGSGGGGGGGDDVEVGLVVAKSGEGGEANDNAPAKEDGPLSRRQRVMRSLRACCGVCWRVCCKPSPSTALWLEHKKNTLPPVPKSKVHACLLWERLLSFCLPHWLRYIIIASVWHLFPFWYTMIRPLPEDQCSEPLVIWMEVTGQITCGRLFGITFLNAIRIRNRPWMGQNFGEAMGELCREMGDGTEDPDPFCMAGMRLPFYVVVYHLCEIVLVFVGWSFFSNIQVCANTVEDSALGLMCYQTFNLFFMCPCVDFAWPWFYLEWEKDVDVITKFKKRPPKRKKVKVGETPEEPPPREMLKLKDGDDDATIASTATPQLEQVGKVKSKTNEVQHAARHEVAATWEQLGNNTLPKEDDNAPTVPKAAPINPRRKGPAGRNKKVTPMNAQGEVQQALGPVRSAGSNGDEWWRSTGLAPPRKGRGANGLLPASSSSPSSPASAPAAGGGGGKSAAKKKAVTTQPKSSPKSATAKLPPISSSSGRPKTAPARS